MAERGPSASENAQEERMTFATYRHVAAGAVADQLLILPSNHLRL